MAAGISTGQRRDRQPGGRSVRVVVRVAPDEYDQLVRHAADAGLTIPSYLAVLGLTPTAVPAALFRSVLTHTTALRRILTASEPAAIARAGCAESTQDMAGLREVIDRLTTLLETAGASVTRARCRS